MSSDNKYDVAIVGGGLAGLSLSILLARKNYRVVVFEKDDYPRHKVCGEYISMESKPFLEDLGIPISAMQLPVIDRLLLTNIHGTSLYSSLPQGGFGISRYLLDDLLARQAVQQGVHLHVKTRVDDVVYADDSFTIHTTSGIFTAKVACGAWGKRSNIDVKRLRSFIKDKKKAAGNYIGVKYHVRIPWPDDLIGMHSFDGGYCGISRIEDDKCCLCYLTTAANLKKNDNDIKVMELNVLMKNPALRKIFTDGTFLFDQPVTISQINFGKKEKILGHVLLLGDAAGMITPLCGNGMSIALHTAKIAFEAIENFMRTNNREQMELVYASVWRQYFSLRILTGQILQRIFEKYLAGHLFLNTFKALPFLHKPLIKATSGRRF